MNLYSLPRFRQRGELVKFQQGQHYIVFEIYSINNITAPDDRGLINSYVQV